MVGSGGGGGDGEKMDLVERNVVRDSESKSERGKAARSYRERQKRGGKAWDKNGV